MADDMKGLVVRLDADVTNERAHEITDAIVDLGMAGVDEVSMTDDVYVAIRKTELAALRRVERVARHARLLQTSGSWVEALDAIWAALEDPALKEEAQRSRSDG